MAIDLVTSVLVGLLGIVSVVLFVRGLIGVFNTAHESQYPHYHW